MRTLFGLVGGFWFHCLLGNICYSAFSLMLHISSFSYSFIYSFIISFLYCFGWGGEGINLMVSLTATSEWLACVLSNDYHYIYMGTYCSIINLKGCLPANQTPGLKWHCWCSLFIWPDNLITTAVNHESFLLLSLIFLKWRFMVVLYCFYICWR